MLVCGAVLLDGGHEGFELHDDQLGAITGRDIVHLRALLLNSDAKFTVKFCGT